MPSTIPEMPNTIPEMPWATLRSDSAGTPTIRLLDRTETVSLTLDYAASGAPTPSSVAWVTQLPLRPNEALLRVDNNDGFEVWLRRTGRQGRRLQAGEEVVLADTDVVVLRTTDPKRPFWQVKGCVLSNEALPAELRWRFEREESVDLAMTMLCCSNPWLSLLGQSAPAQCSLDAQAVLLRVSTGAVPLLAQAAVLETASGAPPESDSQPESKTDSLPCSSTPPQSVYVPASALPPTPVQKTTAGNGGKRRRAEISGP